VTEKPSFRGDIYVAPDAEARIGQWLAARDFVVQCDWASAPEEKEAAKSLARDLQMGLIGPAGHQGPRHRQSRRERNGAGHRPVEAVDYRGLAGQGEGRDPGL